jgi:hypothetical protein
VAAGLLLALALGRCLAATDAVTQENRERRNNVRVFLVKICTIYIWLQPGPRPRWPRPNIRPWSLVIYVTIISVEGCERASSLAVKDFRVAPPSPGLDSYREQIFRLE